MTENKVADEQTNAGSTSGASRGGRLLQAVLTLLVLAVGIGVAVIFLKLRRSPERAELEIPAPLVEVQRLEVEDIPMVVRGYGTVAPKVEVSLVPQVSGRVVFVHSELKAGGVIPAHEKILQIDPRDYELAVRQARAAVAETQVRLDTQTAEAEVARREWRQLHPNAEPTSPLVFREPQVRQAEAALESAEATLATAELHLQRTTVSLPFDVMVARENVDLGQYVSMGQAVANAYGIAAFEIRIPLEDEELAWFDAFRMSSDASRDLTGSHRISAEVKATFAGGQHTWQGEVVRTTGQVDPISRMVSVVVEVPLPFEDAGKPPLLPGMFVEVFVAGKTLENAVAIPRYAIHGASGIWLVEDDRLHIRDLDIVRTDDTYAYVTSGIPDNARIVVSAMDAVVEAMRVRTRRDGTELVGQATETSPKTEQAK